ncbi:hypothetical protein MMC09_003276, partial [Bachmanniomyces sp. S44760]|nr:hypothetical protein [Bachmanniomyces sp. S44760]
GFMADLENGRGLWTSSSESACRDILAKGDYHGIKFSDVIQVLQCVAAKHKGYSHQQTQFDAFAFCHKVGILHTESSMSSNKEVTYVFASPIHQRVAHRRLLPGPDQGTASDHRPLLQVCLAAIKRLSPSAIQPRRVHSNGRSIISEATIQDEIYCCLHYELHHLPILSEYAHSLSGRIDFYIYDKKWGVEILQNGNKSQVMEHMARFGPDGKYRSWNILDDYIVINFCFKSKLQKLRILDSELQSHFLQVTIDPDERLAEVYTYDMQFKDRLILSEGRQGSTVRAYSSKVVPKALSAPVSNKDRERYGEEVRSFIEGWKSQGNDIGMLPILVEDALTRLGS